MTQLPHICNFDSSVVKDLQKINEELTTESKKETPDDDKILKLRMQKLLRGMELNTGIANYNTRRGIPY